MSRTPQKGRTFFFALFAVLALGTLLLVKPFLGVIAFSLVTVLLLRPVYAWIGGRRRLEGHNRLAVTLTMLIALLIIFTPLLLLSLLILNQAAALLDAFESADGELFLETLLTDLEEALQTIPLLSDLQIDEAQVTDSLTTVAIAGLGWLASQVLNLGGSFAAIFINFLIFLVLVASLLPAWDNLIIAIEELNPLDISLSDLYVHKATTMTVTMIKGVFVVALVQSLVMGLAFWLVNIPYAAFLAVICFFLAIVPALGISFIVIPMAAILLLMGETATALLVLFAFYGVANPLNRVLQPRPNQKEIYFNFALVIIAAFGGIQLFGLIGIIYGPVIMILLLTSINIYLEYFSRSAEEPAEDLAPEQELNDESTPTSDEEQRSLEEVHGR